MFIIAQKIANVNILTGLANFNIGENYPVTSCFQRKAFYIGKGVKADFDDIAPWRGFG
jgi:hypothetical protein